MNKDVLVNIRGNLDGEAIRILRDIPEARIDPATPKGQHDVVLRAGDVTAVVEVKAQRTANAASARQLIDYARQLPHDTRLILIARNTTKDARHLLEEAGIGVLDATGNVRVRLPGIFLWTEGRTAARPAATQAGHPPAKLTGKAGIAAQALLTDPLREWQVRDLAARADISTALAHRVLARLEREGLVETSGAGPNRVRRITNPTALLDLWVEELRDRGATQARAYRLARDPRALARALSQRLTEKHLDHAVTGAAGAALLAPFVTAIPVTDLWVPDAASLDDVLADLGAERVQEGHNIAVRQAAGDAPLAFRQRVKEVWVANPFRLLYDLRQDPRRGREQADRLREEVIHF